MESSVRRPSQSYDVGVYVQPDVLASFEFTRTYQRRDHLIPEVKLMFAVLTNAIECLQKYSGAKSRRCRKIFAEAEAWIFNVESRMFYSFEHVCEVLELDPSYLRGGLMRWKEAIRSGTVGTQRRIREPLRYRRRVRDTKISF